MSTFTIVLLILLGLVVFYLYIQFRRTQAIDKEIEQRQRSEKLRLQREKETRESDAETVDSNPSEHLRRSIERLRNSRS